HSEHCETDSAVYGVNESAVVPVHRPKLGHGAQVATTASAKRVHPLGRSRMPRSRSNAARRIRQSAADEGAPPCGGRTLRARAERRRRRARRGWSESVTSSSNPNLTAVSASAGEFQGKYIQVRIVTRSGPRTAEHWHENGRALRQQWAE